MQPETPPELTESEAAPPPIPPTWRQLHPADDPQVEAERFARHRALPTWRKMEMMEELNELADELVMVDLLERFPNATKAELHRRLLLRWGSERAVQAFDHYLASQAKAEAEAKKTGV